VRLFLIEMLPVAVVLWVTEEVHRVALEGLLATDRRDLSLVDHVSFTLMRHRGVDRAFAFDTHFAYAGFRCLP
jgi:predicted nucleic acid-binding protein